MRACGRRLIAEQLEDRALLAVLPPEGLVSWYRAEDDPTLIIHDWSGDNNGTPQGTSFTTGEVQHGFSFDGSSYITVPPSPSLMFADTSFSIDLWFNTSTLATDQILLSKGFSDATEEYTIVLNSDGSIYWDYGDGQAFVESTPTGVTADEWHHLAVTYDRAASPRGAIYVDGAAQTILSSGGDPHIVNASSPLYIGSQKAGSPYYDGRTSFTGVLDEIQFFSRELTTTEIQSIYQAGAEGQATIVVNTSGDDTDPDDGVTSLREAIDQSNVSTGDRDVIGFNIPQLPVGLVSRWSAEKAANDSIGINDGTLKNGASFAPGVIGEAFDFTVPGSYVEVPDSPSLQLGFGGITLDAWVKADASSAYRTIIGKVDPDFPYADYELRINDTNRAEFLATDCGTGGCGGFTTVTSGSIVADGTFHHVAGVRRTNGLLEIYVDGALENTVYQPVENTDSGGPLVIGGPSDGNDFQGLIDEAEVYHRALSTSEINNVYRTQKALMTPATVPTAVSWYRAEGNANDSVGENNGTLQNGATFGAGQVGQAFSLDGVDDTVDLGNSPALDIPGNFTFAAWINQSSPGVAPFVLADYDAAANMTQGSLDIENGLLHWYQVTDTSSDLFVGSTLLSLNQWYHVAVVRNDVAKTVTLFVNGVQDGSGTSFYNGTVVGLQGHKFLGSAGPNFPNTFFQGQIDEAQIFNSALSKDQIQSLYAAGASVPQIAGEVSHYAAEKAANDSIDGHDGTVQGGAAFGPGVIGSGFHFDGVNSSVAVPASSDWNFGTGDFSVDFWEKSDTQGANRMYAFSFAPESGRNLDFDFDDDVYGLWVYWNGGGGNAIRVGAAGEFTNGDWHHIALTRAGTTFSLYVDGALRGSTDYSPAIDLSGGDNNRIGARGDDDFFWNGSIDETGILGRALAASEINSIYQAGARSLSLTPHVPQPVSWYQAESNANDSADGIDGTLQGGTTFAPGTVGQAFSFTGTNQTVAIADSPNLAITGSLSLDAWINPTDLPPAGRLGLVFFRGDNRPSLDPFYLAITDTGHVRFHIGDASGAQVNLDSPGTIALGQFIHIAGTLDNTTGVMKIFINGVDVVATTTTTRPYGTLTGASPGAGIGNLQAGSTLIHQFSGLIDEVHVFNTSLTSDQVQALYAAGASGNVPEFGSPRTPVSLFRGEGNTNDSADGNNGTPQGGVGFAPGIVQQAFSFDGVDDVITTSTTDLLNSSTFTLEAWVKPSLRTDSNGGSYPNNVFSNDLPGQFGNGFGVNVYSNGSSISSQLTVEYNNSFHYLDNLNFQPDVWYHVATVYTASTISTYVNGTLVDSFEYSPLPQDGESFVRIGEHNEDDLTYGTRRFFKGLIDEAAIYSVALSPAEIQAHVAAAQLPQSLVHTISPTTALPAITDRVVIDGYTQPGASANTLSPVGLIHDYELNGTFADALGGPALVPAGGVLGSTSYSFDKGQGLSLTGAIDSENYSIELVFRFSDISSYRKIIDFKDLTDDSGLYNRGSQLGFYSPAFGPDGAFAADTDVHVMLTRDAISHEVIGYADGVEQFRFTDGAGLAVFSEANQVIHFLRDDLHTGTEQSAGIVDRIRIYNAPLSAAEVRALSRGAVPATPSLGNNAHLLVELSGQVVDGGSGLSIQTDDSTVRGLVINRFVNQVGGFGNGNAIDILGQRNTVEGNFIGTDASGTVELGNADGVVVEPGSQTTVIGGPAPAARNLVSGNFFTQVLIYASSENTIQGNFIGTDVTGAAKLPGIVAFEGVAVLGSFNYVVGNVIAGNDVGIQVGGIHTDTGNVVQNNRIGTDWTGTLDLGNTSQGIAIYSADNLVGGFSAAAGNIIAFNGTGIAVYNPFFDADYIGTGNAILGNSIHDNVGLGIDLDNDGVTANDLTLTADSDAGPNNLQNFPEIGNAALSGGKLLLTYRVPSDALNSSYPLRVEFFKADADGTEGQTLIGTDFYAETTAGDVVSIVLRPTVSLAAGDKIIATATDGSGNTSEFSASVAVEICGVVFNTNDSGNGSLRQAILCANATPGLDTISFSIPGDGVHTISPSSALPAITDSVIIDGYSQPGASPNTLAVGNNAALLIELNGASAGSGSGGLNIQSNGSTIRGLVINGFSGDGISIVAGFDNVISGNFIGTDASGSVAKPNTGDGVSITGAGQRNVIGTDANGIGDLGERNVISGNALDGVFISDTFTFFNIVAGNYIGTSASGLVARGNGHSGVVVTGASFNRIGGATAAERNVLSGNLLNGVLLIEVGTDGNDVQGNFIGTDATGTGNLGNKSRGVSVRNGAGNSTIGGLGPGAGNVIAFNTLAGVIVREANSNNVAILGNSIFSNGNLGIALDDEGVTPNDAGDADAGPNNFQNFPVISYATRDAGKLKVKYTVPSDSPNSTYPLRVEFFLADVKGQGTTFLGFDMLTEAEHDAGAKTVTLTTAAPIKVFDTIVATATDSLEAAAGGGPANTSEFSALVTIVSPWKNLNPGRLRWDVNNDTFVAADDVVAIINYINAKGSGLIPDDAKNEKPYCDVDGDNNVVATDVVEIINYINAGRQQGGEAEATDSATVQGSAVDVITLLAADVAAQAARKRRI